MSFEDFFDINIVLNSLSWNESKSVYGQIHGWPLNYSYENLLTQDILYLNALKKGQINLYEQFITKTFFNRLKDIIGSKSISTGIVPILNLFEDENGNKHIVYDLNIYISAILNSKMITEIEDEIKEYNENIEGKINAFREILRAERKKLNDILQKKSQSEYYDKFILIFNEETKKFNSKINGVSLTIDNMLESKISFCQKMIFACRHFKEFFTKELNFQDLLECFDYDKFCLILCYSMLEQSVSSQNEITSSMNYCLNYFKAYEAYKKKNPGYNPNIVIYNKEKNKHQVISAEELSQKFKSILDSHPEFHNYSINTADFDKLIQFVLGNDTNDLSKKDLTALLRMFLSNQNYDTVSSSEIEQNIQSLNKASESSISIQEKHKIRQQIEKMEFLLERKPIKIIKGQGTFAKYYGYIYSNGYVVFDTLDKDFNKSYGNAMFIMPYEKMRTFSNITKKELRSSYKGVIIPIVHRGNWKEKIKEVLDSKTSIDISDSINDTIDLSKIIDIAQLDELKKLHANLTVEEADKIEKRKIYIEKMLEIDEALGLEANGELSDTNFNDEVEEATKSENSFIELFTSWKLKHQGIKVKRNPIVAAITKKRARDIEGNYCCELCGAKSFESSAFDSHHVLPLSSGGIDNIYNTVCLCPNCHRFAHSGKMTLYQQYELLKKVRTHILKENPEYLPKLDRMISPISQSNEHYQTHKEEIDHNFSVLWNGENPKLR